MRTGRLIAPPTDDSVAAHLAGADLAPPARSQQDPRASWQDDTGGNVTLRSTPALSRTRRCRKCPADTQTVGVVAPDDCSFRRRAHEIRNFAKLGRLGDGVGMSSQRRQRRLSARRRLAEVGRSVERGPRCVPSGARYRADADLPPRNGYLVHPLRCWSSAIRSRRA